MNDSYFQESPRGFKKRKKKKALLEKNLLLDQMTEMSRNVFCCGRVQNLNFERFLILYIEMWQPSDQCFCK